MKKYSFYFWLIVLLSFLVFIGLISYWYPNTSDEYKMWNNPFTWDMLKDAYLRGVPRISFIFGPPIFYFGKWSFLLLNPLVQLANSLCIFYIVFLRLPDIKDLKDMPYFVIILCMSVFFVCCPSDTVFWISGAFNYSWVILFFCIMICFLRQIYANKFIFKDTWFIKVCFFILGIFVGMLNESIVPIALGGVICFALFCEYKSIKTPRALSFLIFGLAIGCLIFFSAPAHYCKMTTFGFAPDTLIPLYKKLYFHIYHIDTVLRNCFYLPVLVILGLFIGAIDKKNRNFPKEAFWCSLIFLFLSFCLSMILVITPAPVRAYYPSSIMFIVSFLFFVKYITDTYKFNFPKLFCYLIMGVSLCLMPRFVYPFYYLHLQEKGRMLSLKHNPNSRIMPYIFLKGPTKNLTTVFIDWANNIKIGEDQYIVKTNPPINW